MKTSNLSYINHLVIILTHLKLLFHLYQTKCLLAIWNCCKINYFNTHGTTVSCLSIFLLENQISSTIILNDLIFCKLDVIPNTLFSMHKVLIWSLKNGNFNRVIWPIKLAEGLKILVSWWGVVLLIQLTSFGGKVWRSILKQSLLFA